MERYFGKESSPLEFPEIKGKFYIEEVIGGGASSKVYRAIHEDEKGIRTEHILKEYNPRYLELVRDDNKILHCIDENDEEDYRAGLQRFTAGYLRQLELRAVPELKNVTSNIQGIYEANGTKYIDMTCNEGQNYEDMTETSLHTLLRRIKALTRIIGAYHNHGMLHLDVKPNNIFAIPETPEMVLLFDFDSVTGKDELTGGWSRLSYTPTWAAWEHENGLRDMICEASDLFSIGEILFVKLMDRHSEPEERGSASDYTCIDTAELLQNVNPAVKPLLKELLRRLLCNVVTVRYQSAEEVIPVLDELIMLTNPAKKFLKEKLPAPSSHFVGREKELEEVHTRLKENNVLVLGGVGGIGKTALAKQYAHRYNAEYDIRMFASCTGTIMDMVNSHHEVPIENLEAHFDYLVPAEEYYKYKLGELEKLCNERVLVIVDNLDYGDEHLEDLAKLGCKLLITSRKDYSDTSFSTLEVKSIEDKETLWALFESYYKKPLAAEEKQLLEKLFTEMQNHTKLIELLAKLMRAGRLNAKTLYKQLSLGVRKMSREKISSENGGEKADIYTHLKKLFDCSKLNEKEQYVLACLSLLPHTGVPTERFCAWCGLRNYEEINTLIETGWITWEETEDIISLHPVVAEVVIDLVIQNPTQCKTMLNRMIAFTKENPDNLAGRLHLADNLEKIRTLLAQECDAEMTEQQANCLEAIGSIFYGRKDGDFIRAYCREALCLYEKISKEENFAIADCCYTLGRAYRLTSHKEAIGYFERAVGIYEKLLGPESEKTGECYVALAELWARKEEFQTTREYMDKAETVYKNFSDKKSVSVGKIAAYLGIWYSSTDTELAMKYLREAEAIFDDCCGKMSVPAADNYYYLGELYCSLQQYEEAEKCYLTACETRELLLGEQHKDTGTCYNTLHNFYLDCLGDIEKGALYLAKQTANFPYYIQNA